MQLLVSHLPIIKFTIKRIRDGGSGLIKGILGFIDNSLRGSNRSSSVAIERSLSRKILSILDVLRPLTEFWIGLDNLPREAGEASACRAEAGEDAACRHFHEDVCRADFFSRSYLGGEFAKTFTACFKCSGSGEKTRLLRPAVLRDGFGCHVGKLFLGLISTKTEEVGDFDRRRNTFADLAAYMSHDSPLPGTLRNGGNLARQTSGQAFHNADGRATDKTLVEAFFLDLWIGVQVVLDLLGIPVRSLTSGGFQELLADGSRNFHRDVGGRASGGRSSNASGRASQESPTNCTCRSGSDGDERIGS